MKSFVLFLVAAVCGLGQSPVGGHDSSPSVVGTWVAEHRSKGGIGSRWVFRSDRTLSMSPGAMVDMPYKFDGSTLTLPPGRTGPDAKPELSTVSFSGNQMCMRLQDAKGPLCFARMGGAATSGGSLIVGKWKAIPPQPLPANAYIKPFLDTIWIFTADSTLKLRIPFRTDQGTWNQATQSFTLNYGGTQISGKFRLEGGKLVLTQSDGKIEDTYLRDDD